MSMSALIGKTPATYRKKKLRIALLVRSGHPYDYVYTSNRDYLKHLKKPQVNPEIAMYYYIKRKYPTVKVDKYSVNTLQKLDPKKYDAIFATFLDVVMPALEILYKKRDTVKYNRFMRKLKSFGNKLHPSLQFINFITEKCSYHTWLRKKGFPIIEPTRCVHASSKPIRVPKKEIFLKPVPSAGSKDLFHVTPETKQKTIDEYFKSLSNKGVKKIMIQDYKDFGTEGNPEYRTYWLGSKAKYQYTIRTSAYGFSPEILDDPLPASVKKLSVRLIKALSKKFKTTMYITRLDWAKVDGKWVINEIEWAPGVFSEKFSSWDWTVDEKMADIMVNEVTNRAS